MPAYISKYNNERNNKVILLMITDSEKRRYLAVKSLPALFRGITPSHNEDSYCLNCYHSYCYDTGDEKWREKS